MVFSSLEFLFRFLPVFMLIYLIVPAKYRNIVLLAGSLIFYGVGEPYFVLLLILSVLLNYGLSRYMFWEPRTPQKDRERRRARRRKTALISALVIDFGILFVFKYWDFTAGVINDLANRETIPFLMLALPLGISFYTFQMVSYQIDCYRGTMEEPAGFISFAAYVSMFPQLIAGPIVRYDEVSDRMAGRKIRIRDLENGLKLFTVGLGLKVLLANQIGTLWNTIMSAGAGNLHITVAWLGAIAYSFQIYFDFWGYSVMAMGLGKMLGFRIPRNFDDPYVSRSISEFWRRWHITLGRWFREYVYFPMGGSRKGSLRTVVNLFVVWACTGLWHGADWNFLLWGMLFFLILTVEKNSYGRKLEQSKVVGHIYTLVIIPITWVVFAITDLGQLVAYLGNLFGIHRAAVMVGMQQLERYLQQYWVLLIACILFATPYPRQWYQRWKDRWFMVMVLLLIFWFSVREIMVGSNNPFLYFRF
ncbi:MAG: MBOAT family protein [Lachnospiraceae bacterium]|nr:MBOAT family protein [Lachnospiraceae bacterium]